MSKEERDTPKEKAEVETVREEFIFKAHLTRELEDSRDASIRSIMTAVDLSIADDRQRRRVRKVVLDQINTFFRDVCGIMERVID